MTRRPIQPGKPAIVKRGSQASGIINGLLVDQRGNPVFLRDPYEPRFLPPSVRQKGLTTQGGRPERGRRPGPCRPERFELKFGMARSYRKAVPLDNFHHYPAL